VLTHVEFKSDAFPPYDTESGEVNPGRFGKRLAEFLAEALRRQGEAVGEIFAEDWGYVVPIENAEYKLWIGVGNYEEYPDGFLCFLEPHQEYVRKLFRKISTNERLSRLQQRVDTALKEHGRVRDIKWSTYREFNNPTA
jgi:hypothetical protein